MELIYGDSIEAMKRLSAVPDVILLDPMFPKRQKSALIKKKFQLLQQLESPCGDEEALLNAAVTAGAKRILIKRPLK
jgi:16S rRNA (guanine1516-N2)-methyltransferase